MSGKAFNTAENRPQSVNVPVLRAGTPIHLSQIFEMEYYRAPFLGPFSCEPLYRSANEVPIEGKLADVYGIAEECHVWLLESEVLKLFFWATLGVVVGEEPAGWYRKTLRNRKSVGIGRGRHYLQEDNRHLIGGELRK